MEVKIYRVGEHDYVAASNERDAMDAFQKFHGYSNDELIGLKLSVPVQLTHKEMNEMTMLFPIDKENVSMSFARGLDITIEQGEIAPFHFANMEFEDNGK